MKTKALSLGAGLLLLLAAPLAAAVDPAPAGSAANDDQYTAAQPANGSSDVASDADAEPVVAEPATAEDAGDVDLTADPALPQTASPLAVLALLGLGGAVSAFGVRRVRRHA